MSWCPGLRLKCSAELGYPHLWGSLLYVLLTGGRGHSRKMCVFFQQAHSGVVDILGSQQSHLPRKRPGKLTPVTQASSSFPLLPLFSESELSLYKCYMSAL